MSNGWVESASAWIASMGDRGDYAREFVLDAPMMERVRAKEFEVALDIGCGGGRFCRMMQACGIRTVGVDPVETLIQHARYLDSQGTLLNAPNGWNGGASGYSNGIDLSAATCPCCSSRV